MKRWLIALMLALAIDRKFRIVISLIICPPRPLCRIACSEVPLTRCRHHLHDLSLGLVLARMMTLLNQPWSKEAHVPTRLPQPCCARLIRFLMG